MNNQKQEEVSKKQVITIQIVSDVMCPWCWIGKKKLEQAMRQLDHKYEFQVKWEPYLLKPNMPEGGILRKKSDDGKVNDDPR